MYIPVAERMKRLREAKRDASLNMKKNRELLKRARARFTESPTAENRQYVENAEIRERWAIERIAVLNRDLA